MEPTVPNWAGNGPRGSKDEREGMWDGKWSRTEEKVVMCVHILDFKSLS